MTTVKVKAYPVRRNEFGALVFFHGEPPTCSKERIEVEIDPSAVWVLREYGDFKKRLYATTNRGVVFLKKCEQPIEVQRLFPARITNGPSTSDLEAAKAFDWTGLE